MAINAASFKAYLPEFVGLEDAFVNLYIAEAALYVNRNKWLAKSDFAHALWTAYLISNAQAGAQGVLKGSEKVGDLSITYAEGNNANTARDASSYLDMFNRLMTTLPLRPVVVT